MAMNARERRAVGGLALVFAVRMFGLFMLLPVLAIYAAGLEGSTPVLVGMALGIYGLTQGGLQIAFGMASDWFGRKRVITIGLVVFAVGSGVAAGAEGIGGLLVGRALQGAGAISAAVLALVADLTRESERSKAMAVMGVSIGAVFLLSLGFAPLLESMVGVEGIFWLSAGLAVGAIGLVWGVVPGVEGDGGSGGSGGMGWLRMREVLRSGELLRLNGGIFLLHMILTALFVVLPGRLEGVSGLGLAEHWKVYAPVLVLSVGGMLAVLRYSQAKGRGRGRERERRAFGVAVGGVGVGVLLVGLGSVEGLVGVVVGLWVFFVGFNALEAMLPALVSRLAPAADKGAAIGVFHTFQFLGMFCGGTGAGWVSGVLGAGAVYWLCAGLAGGWLVVAVRGGNFGLGD